jgi:hypothetical protein
MSGAALALAVQYRRPGDSQGSAIVWRVLQVMALVLVAVSFFKVAQHFNSYKLQLLPQPSQNEVFLNYVSAMNRAQEELSVVLFDRDARNVDSSIQALQAVSAPDSKADELRKRLVDLLIKAQAEITANPTPLPGPRRTSESDLKLKEAFGNWTKEYEEWLKSSAPKSNH